MDTGTFKSPGGHPRRMHLALLVVTSVLGDYAGFLNRTLAEYKALHPEHACAVFKHTPFRILKPSYPNWLRHDRGYLDLTRPHVAYCIPLDDHGSWLRVDGDVGYANWSYDGMYFLRIETNKILYVLPTNI